jgi:hypothetical protein
VEILPADILTQEQDTESNNNLRQAQASVLNNLSMAESGILSVQRPPLNLTGERVTIGFIDTGERVIIMSS